MDHQSAIPRPSGLPRPSSRLPVLRASTSQNQLRPAASTEQLRKKPSVPSLSRQSQLVQPLQKKTSRASLARSSAPSNANAAPASQRPPASTTSSRRVSGIPSLGSSRTSIAPNDPAFKRPFARPPSRQSKPAPRPSTGSFTPREDDALGSLEGFRSVSRASSRAGSRAGFHENDPEPDYAVQEAVLEPVQVAKKKSSRPSLSERTVESLSQLPASPAGGKGRRRSSFFNADNSMPPPLRPASAMSSNSGSRPTTSDGTFNAAPATPKRLAKPPGRLSMTAPGNRSVSANVSTPAASTPSRISSMSRPVSTVKKAPLAPTSNLQNAQTLRPLSSSKSMVARTPKTRPSLNGMFDTVVSPPGTSTSPRTPIRSSMALSPKKTPETIRKVSSSSIALREQIAKAKAARKSEVVDDGTEQTPKAESSSNVLRAQIAKAKEAAKRAKTEPERTSTPPRDAIVPDPQEIASFDFGLDNPFNQGGRAGSFVLRKRIDGARVDGRLNIAAMGLKEIPDELLQMYQYDPNSATAWGEVVDLTSIIAADNEFDSLPEAMFPDISVEEAIDMDEGGPQFGGVQSIDLHGNMLNLLPVGMRHLNQLTKLNLARNKMTADAFTVISQLTSLRELKLAENELHCDLPSSIESLQVLEILELQDNKITGIPSELGNLVALKTLNISNNQVSAIPNEVFSGGLLTLLAAKNRLEGRFFHTDSALRVQELNLANNALTSLSSDELTALPSLKYLNISTNRFTTLPDMQAWSSLETLLLAENKIKLLPDSIYSLPIHTIDLTANDLTTLDPRMAKMPLKHLTVSANPLRERKFLTMATEDIQRDLFAKLRVDEPVEVEDAEQDTGTGEIEETRSGWQVTPSGTLDLASKDLENVLEEGSLAVVAGDIRQLYLQSNAFDHIPASLASITTLAVLDLSKNSIKDVLTSSLDLPKLRELRLANNRLTSLESLIQYLRAPALQTLDISANRLSGSLPTLRPHFLELISVIASDNSISELTPEALTGLKIVNLANNDIERLEPRIGLLAGTLTSLNVEGNKFRVPNYTILQKGTDSVLTWLRDKIPRESWRSDGTEFWDADDGAGTF